MKENECLDIEEGVEIEPSLLLGLIVVVPQLLSHVQLFAIWWAAALQASLSFTISWSLPWALEEVEKEHSL